MDQNAPAAQGDANAAGGQNQTPPGQVPAGPSVLDMMAKLTESVVELRETAKGQAALLTELKQHNQQQNRKSDKPKPLPPTKRNVNMVIFDFEEYNRNAGLSEAEAINCLVERLEGEARCWWRTLVQSNKRPNTWEGLKALMRDKWLAHG